MLEARDYFPLGIAVQGAFCNRTEETDLLLQNIQAVKHTLLIASRRYGKSSLALRALHKSKLPFSEVDFYMSRNEKNIEAYLLKAIVELIGKALGPVDKLVTSIKKYVKTLRPKIELSAGPFSLELQPDQDSDPASNVKEALMLLEHLLAEHNQHAALLLDEFQVVGSISKGHGIEAAIRHVAQKTHYLTLIFSGSQRHLLETMFEDKARPLYKLCWKLSLARIESHHYEKHIQAAAKLAWKQTISAECFAAIMTCSERHPYYVNKLCDRVWTEYASSIPTAENVIAVWDKILAEEKTDAVKEITPLSPGQKNVLHYLATVATQQLTSKQAMLALQMTSSSILVALTGLEEKSIIEKRDEEYHIINPVVAYYAAL
ncbi:MAG: hypothetical protein CMF50_05985 [Legionellales bacterium]|nr:hypothetical protein [Legionellales bacterium]|tara:strand:+ start:83103 stop:84227 length:1125 start_codon:yes stop_codon:yes gene_type:complete